jgi:hypothetical protein
LPLFVWLRDICLGSKAEAGRADQPWPLEAEMKKLVDCTVAGILFIGAGFAVDADEPAVSPPHGSTLLKVIADGVQIYAYLRGQGRRL